MNGDSRPPYLAPCPQPSFSLPPCFIVFLTLFTYFMVVFFAAMFILYPRSGVTLIDIAPQLLGLSCAGEE